MIADAENQELKPIDQIDLEARGHKKEIVVMQSIKSIEDAWNESDVKLEPSKEEIIPEIVREQPELLMPGPTPYMTRSGRVSHPPNRHIETAYAVVNETYIQNFQDMGSDENKVIIECTYAMKALLFQRC